MNAVTPYDPYLPVAAVVEPHADPSTLIGWPHMLPVELALGEIPAAELCDAYKITRAQFVTLVGNPAFRKAYEVAQEQLQKEGVSFRVKARMQADALLNTSWRLIHNEGTPATVKADLIKTTYRVAGLEPKESGAGNAQTNLQINVHL